MTSSHFINAPATRANLNRAIEHTAPHLRPVLEAVRDLNVGMFFVQQSTQAFRLPRDRARPAIVLIGDDYDRALGPHGFHLPSVRRAIRACSAFAVVSSAPSIDVYASIATTAAATRRSTMLIETRLEQELPWMSLIQTLAPRCPIVLSTIAGGRA